MTVLNRKFRKGSFLKDQDCTLIFEEQPMTLTKAQIVEALFAKNLFTKTESAQVIDTLFELIKQSLQNGEDVLISGLGKFSVSEKHARIGRNPQTGEPMMLPPRKIVTFKCSGVLRGAMNGEDN
jgi:integration host factor subunit alpha